MLAKAIGLDADEVIADLEDAVDAGSKDQAREQVAAFLDAEAPGAAALSVRINTLASPWGERDVVELVRSAGRRITSLIVPKVEHPAELAAIDRLLGGLGDRANGVGLQALVETAAGLLRAGEIAGASPRLQSLILGYADLAASLGRAPGVIAPERWLYAQETVLVAARARGVQAIDGPYLEIRDDEGLMLRAAHVRELGFDGKWAVHPGQIGIINAAFTPEPEELAHARAVLEALERAQGRGAVELAGAMIDEASRKHALEVVARGRAAGLAEVSG
jgi:citrate lyase subunit beta/citryl-CoA lyase